MWEEDNSRGPDQLTPDLKSLIQEIVDREGWVSGNALNIMIKEFAGLGERTVEHADDEYAHAPVITIFYHSAEGL